MLIHAARSFDFEKNGTAWFTLIPQDIQTRPGTPVLLRVIAEELVEPVPLSQRVRDRDTSDIRTHVDIAVIIDDVINRKPRFLQNQ